MTEFRYAIEPDLEAEEFTSVLTRSGLSERRPVEDRPRIIQMLRHADVIVTARTSDGTLIGVSRAITDFSYCTYLSDLAVDRSFQRQGIGQQLLERTHDAAGRKSMLILLAAPLARDYYPRIGMQAHPSCWYAPGSE